MSRSVFSVTEHTLPCSHIREYPRATVDASDQELHLAIKQYVPLDNPTPQPGDVTIIGAHANGFPKELYEPLWDELHGSLARAGIRIRAIWIADAAWQGYSSVLNESKLGNDPNWLDHSRDLFLLINHFRQQIPQPIIGIGHSMGACQLAALALLHPRLLTSLVLLDPVIDPSPTSAHWNPAHASAARRDLWPSRAAARAALARSPFYQAWDSRVLALWALHGLRDLPTALHPAAAPHDHPVTLRTTKHQEVATFMRPEPATGGLARDEPAQTFARLPTLRPGVLYVFGARSALSGAVSRAAKMAATGVGQGGSGGVEAGRVREVVLDAGHLVPMERVGETAGAATGWIVSEVARWRDEVESVRAEVERTPVRERAMMRRELWEVVQAARSEANKAKL